MNNKTRNLISIKKRKSLSIPFESSNEDNKNIVLTLQANVMSLGYIFTETLFNRLFELSKEDISKFSNTLIPVLKNIRGADVIYDPMYPNFPQQVIEMSDLELYFNAILHYWTVGDWRPEYEKLPREFAFENIEFQLLDYISENEFKTIFSDLISSNESLSEEDRKFIVWFMDNYDDLEVNSDISYKEIMCLVAGYMLNNNKDISSFVKTTTDVLRIATYLSDGDISLSSKTKYKSFPRKIRKQLVKILDKVIIEEDLNLHRGKWIRLAHTLHVGDYSTKVYNLIQKVRENKRIETFNGKVEELIDENNVPNSVKLLMTRPGYFSRRLDKLLRMNEATQKLVIDSFLRVVDSVSTRVLLQLLGHFNQRKENIDNRVVFPKGNTQRVMVIEGLESLDSKIINKLTSGIKKSLEKKFSTLESLGNVYVEPYLKNAPIPTQQRSASSGMFSVARGTHMPIIGDKNTLRFFIYWKGFDIDLSATMHNENFKNIGRVSYTNLKSNKYQSYHSGDIRNAPNGASEFIDITMDGALKSGARYIAMNVIVYSGPSFAEHEICYAGWMTREYPNSNEIYDPKTVEQKIDLNSDTRNYIPIIFDLKEREAIWVDMSTGWYRSHYYGNNVESNKSSIENVIKSIVTNNNKVNLYDLFTMHGNSRGKLVDSMDNADTVFSMKRGVTPFDVNEIQTKYVV